MRLRTRWTALLFLLVAVEAAGQGTPDLHYANGQLTLRADLVPAKTLWQQVAQAAGIRLHVAEEVGDMLVSGAFRDMPLAQALMRLVSPNDFAIFYEPESRTNQAARIADLFVFPPSSPAISGRAEPAALPATPDARIEARRLGRLIAEPGEVAQRRLALADLLALNSPAVATGLEFALGAPEPELRREVVQALGEVPHDTPPTALGQVVMGDRDAQVRLDAVRVLAGLEGDVARLFIEQAAEDRDENVREAARQALKGFSGR